jgi:hypothetical protein
MKSSPTIVTLAAPKGAFYEALPLLLSGMKHHLTVTSAKTALLTLANGTELTDLAAILATLSVLLPSPFSFPTNFSTAQAAELLAQKKVNAASLAASLQTKNFLCSTLSPSFVDVYLLLTNPSLAEDPSADLQRWSACTLAAVHAATAGKFGVAAPAPGNVNFVKIDASFVAPPPAPAAAADKGAKEKGGKPAEGGKPAAAAAGAGGGGPAMSDEEKAAARAKREAAKKEKAAKKPAPAAPKAAGPVAIDALDFRVGKIVKMW